MNKKFEDLDKEDFTEEEFQMLVDMVKMLSDWERKYNPAGVELAVSKISSDNEDSKK